MISLKRFFSSLVLVIMIFQSLPNKTIFAQQASFDVWDGSVATAFAGGTGTESDPYVIASASQLAFLADRVNAGIGNYWEYFLFKLVSIRFQR